MLLVGLNVFDYLQHSGRLFSATAGGEAVRGAIRLVLFLHLTFSIIKLIFAAEFMIGRGDESPLSFFSDMNTEAIKSNIEKWLSPLLNEKNLFLVDVNVSAGKKIEVFVDSDEGIHIDECALISRLLEKNLDGSGLVPDNYILEVSSPGMTNPLKVPRQFKKRIGRVLDVVKKDGEKIEAELMAADQEKIKLREVVQVKKKSKKKEQEAEAEPREIEIKYADIKKALLVFKF